MSVRRPEVFVSAVSADLKSSRETVKEALLTLGCVPVEQSNFPPDYGTIRDILHRKIKDCDAVVHIAGECAGMESREGTRSQPRRSYTQLEYDIARKLGKRLYVFVCQPSFDYDPHVPEDSERQRLQEQHREMLCAGDHLYTPIGSRAELAQRARELRPFVEELAGEVRREDARLRWAVAAGVILLLAVVLGAFMLQKKQNEALPEQVADAVTAKLIQQAQTARPRDAAAPPRDFRVALQEVAKQFHITPEEAQRVVNEWVAENQNGVTLSKRAQAEFLARNFAKSAELSDKAAAEKLRRADHFPEERAELVLAAAEDLERAGHAFLASGQFSEALRRFEQALSHVSQADWGHLWVHLQNGVGICQRELANQAAGPAARGHSALAIRAFREALDVQPNVQRPKLTAKYLEGGNVVILRARSGERFPLLDRAMTQENLGLALYAHAEHSEGPEKAQVFGEALAAFREALKVYTREQFPQEWAGAQNNLGIVLIALATRSEGPEQARLLGEGLAAFRQALKVFTREQSPQEWAGAQCNLGSALFLQGGRNERPEQARLLAEAVAAFREALKVYTRDQFPHEWARMRRKLGDALSDLTGHSEGSEQARLRAEAVTAYRESLKVLTREHSPQDWAIAQNHLAVTLRNQARSSEGQKKTHLLRDAVAGFLGVEVSDSAEWSGGPEQARLLADAVTALRESLKVLTHEQFPQDWAVTQNHLGKALRDQAWCSEGPEQVRLLAEAVTAFREALKVQTREQFPQDWARTQNNLGGALHDQAWRSKEAEAGQLWAEAVLAFREALKVQTREQFPQDWAGTQNNLGAMLCQQAGLNAGPGGAQLLGEAATAFRAALEVYTPKDFPSQHAGVSKNLKRVETQLRKLKP